MYEVAAKDATAQTDVALKAMSSSVTQSIIHPCYGKILFRLSTKLYSWTEYFAY